MKKYKNQKTYHLMLLPVVIFLVVFTIIPMFGIVMAFQDFIPAKGIFGSKWVGLTNFEFMFAIPDSTQVIINTLLISVGKIIFNIIMAVVFSLLLNEVKNRHFKKAVQTVTYLPYFFSWVVLATMFQSMFSLEGIVNSIVTTFGGEPIIFLASNDWFRGVMIGTDVWKNFGWNSIIYLAALTSIDSGLYEAATIDGANRWKALTKITLPLLIPTIILVTTRDMGYILNAGFDQIFNLYNPVVYETGDIIDTYVYRIGLVQRQYSLGTAVGLLKSVVGLVLIMSFNKIAEKSTGKRIF